MAQDVAVNDEEQRGEHIRRYAELIEAREGIVLQDAKQIDPPKRGPRLRGLAENQVGYSALREIGYDTRPMVSGPSLFGSAFDYQAWNRCSATIFRPGCRQ